MLAMAHEAPALASLYQEHHADYDQMLPRVLMGAVTGFALGLVDQSSQGAPDNSPASGLCNTTSARPSYRKPVKKTLTEQEQRLLSLLRARILLTLEFMEAHDEGPTPASFVAGVRRVVETAATRGDLRSLRLVARDIDKATIGLVPHEREGLDAILRERLGIDKDVEREDMRREVAAIMARGRVASEKQRQSTFLPRANVPESLILLRTH